MILDIARQWAGGSANGLGRAKSAKRPPCRFRCGIEALEDRLAPAVIMVTTAADLVNPDDGKTSLREAIDRANASPQADTIRLAAGVYKIGLAGQNEDANALGDFDITGPVKIQGANARRTIIDGKQLDRVFHILGSADVTFSGLTVRNGLAGSLEQQGGGIRSETGNVTLVNCVVRNNGATESDGGGISTESGDVTLIGSTVRANTSFSGIGGGIDTTGGAVTLIRSVVRDNRADGGSGGISTVSGAIKLSESVVRDNIAFDGRGGGIHTATGTIDINKSSIQDNSAENGSGGGISSDRGDLKLVKSTVTGNLALQGGGVFLGSGTGQVKKSTIAHNIATEAGPDVFGNFISLGHNRIGIADGSTGFVDGVNGDRVGTSAHPLIV